MCEGIGIDVGGEDMLMGECKVDMGRNYVMKLRLGEKLGEKMENKKGRILGGLMKKLKGVKND